MRATEFSSVWNALSHHNYITGQRTHGDTTTHANFMLVVSHSALAMATQHVCHAKKIKVTYMLLKSIRKSKLYATCENQVQCLRQRSRCDSPVRILRQSDDCFLTAAPFIPEYRMYCCKVAHSNLTSVVYVVPVMYIQVT